jgi:hypothetical protein
LTSMNSREVMCQIFNLNRERTRKLSLVGGEPHDFL